MSDELGLIKIHKRNILTLEKQKAELGLHCPMHVQNQLNHEVEEIEEIEEVLRRRLQALLKKAALLGISADPALAIEIEDIQKYFEENENV